MFQIIPQVMQYIYYLIFSLHQFNFEKQVYFFEFLNFSCQMLLKPSHYHSLLLLYILLQNYPHQLFSMLQSFIVNLMLYHINLIFLQNNLNLIFHQ
jgi:hypothetical protein